MRTKIYNSEIRTEYVMGHMCNKLFSALKHFKSLGIDNLPVELFKNGGNALQFV